VLLRLFQAVVAVQGATLLALAVVDHRRKRLRKPATFPRTAPKSVTVGGSEVTVYTYGEDLIYLTTHITAEAMTSDVDRSGPSGVRPGETTRTWKGPDRWGGERGGGEGGGGGGGTGRERAG
jgi:hypothetical protein